MSIAETIIRGVLKLLDHVVGKDVDHPRPRPKLDPPIFELESERIAREAEERRKAGGKA